MKKFIIAILVFGLFGFTAIAQDSQNEPIINPLQDLGTSVVPVRNDTGAQVVVDADLSLQDLEVGTSDTLKATVDQIVKNSSNFSSFDWCRDASSFVGDLPDNAKQSLAWNKNSYSKVVEFVPEDAELAASYKNAQNAYVELNVAYDDMLSDLLADQAAGRFIAVARSGAIEALTEFKSGNPNQDRLNGLAEISRRSVECASPENSDIAVEKLSALFGTSMPTVDAVDVEVESYVDTKITRSDITEGTALVSIEAVADAETMKSYVAGLMSEDEKIVSVEDKEDSVIVRYETPSKFLGFIKSTTNAKITVNNDLSAKVSYPFFSFLSSKSFKANAEEISVALKDAFAVEESVDMEVSVLNGDFRAKALVVTLVTNMIKSAQEVEEAPEVEIEEEMEVDTEVDVEVETDASGTVLEGAPIIEGVDVSVQ